MNNGEIGGPRGRGRGWQPENQPRELRRPRNVTEDSKGNIAKLMCSVGITLSRTGFSASRCDVVIPRLLTAFLIITIVQVKVRISISNDVAIV